MIGSEFQARVWHALTKIPYGKTISYGEIAREVNSPKAVRAVGGAVGANLFSIIFSLSLKRVPEKANEVSALLIVGVSGGAVLPPILGVITDSFHSQLSAIIVLAIVWCYLIGIMRK